MLACSLASVIANGQPSLTALTAAAARAAHLIVDDEPVDFARDSLAGALGRAGFDDSRPAFVSEMVVDYVLPAGLRDAAGQAYADLVGQVAAERRVGWPGRRVGWPWAARGGCGGAGTTDRSA
jgi:hypothetical protein